MTVPVAPPTRVIARRIIKITAILAIIALAGVAIALGTAFFVYKQLATTYDITRLGQMPSHSQVLDGDGKPYGRLQNDQNRVVVSLKDVSPRFIDAIIAREDSRFWQHHGVDYLGIVRATLRNLRNDGRREGASTITQQLARNSLSLGGQNLHRKLIEAMVAGRIEDKYTKDQILGFYLNRIYMGSGVYGVEAASQKYFGKSSKQLSLGEAAMLAGIVRNPNRNSPLKNLDGARSDRDSVLGQMEAQQKISAQDAAAAKAEPILLSNGNTKPLQEDYVLDAVRSELDDLVGADAINQGGLKIYTTIDLRLQQLASDAVEDQLSNIERTKGYSHLTRDQYRTETMVASDKPKTDASPEYLQGALLAVDNRSGAILALVGGRNFEESRYNRALLARRQIGSTFKPFVYATAFAKGMQPDTMVEDSPLRPDEVKNGSKDWKPANSDSNFLGVQPAEIGLIESRNIMSIRVGEWAGMDNVQALAKKAGLDAPRLPSMYLGSFETSLKSLTSAYTVFPNKGTERPAYLIERVDAANGQPIYQNDHRKVEVMSELVAQTTSNVLERVMTEGTGKQASSYGFRAPGAGKTGTTNDYKDAWFVGYTTSLTCGVWVGMDKPQTITAKGYGATLALPIWADFMQSALTSSKRFPALALHGGDANPPQVRTAAAGPADQSGYAYANNNRGASVPVPPPMDPAAGNGPTVSMQPSAGDRAPAAPGTAMQSPADPGSQFIRDPQTGKVVGIDGSVSAAQEQEQLRLQQAQAQQQAVYRAQQDLLRRQQARSAQAVDDPEARVLPAIPVQPSSAVIGQPGVTAVGPGSSYPPAAVPVRRALPVAPQPPQVQRIYDRATNRFVNVVPFSSNPPPAPVPGQRIRRRIYTLQDGTQVTDSDLENSR